VPGADSYVVTIDAGQSDCCPNNPPSGPITASVSGTQFVLPSSLPDCFSYQVSSVNENGIISNPSESACFHPEVICDEVDPDPCEEPEQPGPLACDQGEGKTFVSWPEAAGATSYTVTLTFGGPCCNEEVESRTFIYQITGTQIGLPAGYGDCYSITVEAHCTDFSTSTPSGTICFTEEGCIDNGEGGGKDKSDELSLEVSLSNSLYIYPNPTSDFINIRLESVLESSLNVSLIGSDGRVLNYSSHDLQYGYNLIQMNTETIVNGIYFLQLEIGQEKHYERIIIMK